MIHLLVKNSYLLINKFARSWLTFSFLASNSLRHARMRACPAVRQICDEAHVLKNEETEVAGVISKLRACQKLLITGTPLQARIDFTAPPPPRHPSFPRWQ